MHFLSQVLLFSSKNPFDSNANMQLSNTILSVVLCFAACTHAWTKDQAGVWVANNNVKIIGASMCLSRLLI